MEQLLSQRTGLVGRRFNGEGGYGFIHPDGGRRRGGIRPPHRYSGARQSQVLKEGVRVSYEVACRKMAGMWAKDVCTTD